MEGLLVRGRPVWHGDDTNHHPLPVLQSHVHSRHAHSNGPCRRHLPKIPKNVQHSPEGEYGRRNRQPHVGRRAKIHRAHRLLEHDLVSPVTGEKCRS